MTNVVRLPERHALRVPIYTAVTLADLIVASADFAVTASELLLDNARVVQLRLFKMTP